jgi:hypothetical protein
MSNEREYDDETQRHTSSEILSHFERLNEYEGKNLEQLAKLQDNKEILLHRLAEIRLQRVFWTGELKFELDRRNQWAFDRQEEEDQRIEDEEYHVNQEEHSISRNPYDPNHLVGSFVLADHYGEWFGVITKCVEKGVYSIISSEGRVSTVDSRHFRVRVPTEADRKAFKDLGHLTDLLS